MIYTALASLHLVLVACGAAGWDNLLPNTYPGRCLQVVRAYTGSDASYGFFAPGVSNAVRPTFTLIDADGKEWTDTLDANMGREAKLRVGSGIGMTSVFPDLQVDFLHSWAATMLGRHPTAKQVIVAIEYFDVPPMDEYRAGELPQWIQVDLEDGRESAVFYPKGP